MAVLCFLLFILLAVYLIILLNEYGIGKGKRKTLEPKFEGFKKWRRRRDSNPRDPFGAYTISNRARSTKLRDFSVFALRFVVLFCFAWLVLDKQQWEL